MSSDNSKKVVIEAGAIAQELSLALKDRKPILPFCPSRLPYSWSPGSRETAFFDLSHYQAIEEYCPLDQIITVQCGIKLHALEQFLIANKQWLPVNYSDDQITLLDLILTGNAGPTEIFAGGLRRHILGLTFVLSNGVLAKSGGKVVKNVSGYDLKRFLIGSYGHFAVPVNATVRIYSQPEQTYTLAAISNSVEPLVSVARKISSKPISLVYIDLLDKRLLRKQLPMLKPSMFDGQGYCLLAQIYGDQTRIEAELEAVKKLLSEFSLEHSIFTDQSEQKQLLTSLTQIDACFSPKTEYGRIVEIAVAGGDFIKLCRNKNLIAFPFIYRLGASRLLYCLNDYSEQNHLLGLLNEYAKNENKPLVVAYTDDLHLRKMVNLGMDDVDAAKAVLSIKRRLKEQFDPHNLFNPFVDL